MSESGSPYDTELQMFVDQPREASISRLRFMRWLGERGQLEHKTAGVSAGEYALLARIGDFDPPSAA